MLQVAVIHRDRKTEKMNSGWMEDLLIQSHTGAVMLKSGGDGGDGGVGGGWTYWLLPRRSARR